MVAIADKLGRPSIPTNYAVATTVKTARTAGVAVLETYDLSKFPLDTPAFFLTYKKVTDPTTGEVSVTNVTSWKALVNPDNNTLTNLTLAPGYVDTGNAIGDFVELIPTSFWGNSLVDALLTALNPDGTPKTSALKNSLGNDGRLVDTLNEFSINLVVSGGVWTQLSGLNGTMTALAAYVNGYKNTIAAVTARPFTVSKDTYVDVVRNTGTNAFTLVYNEVANGAAAPALLANATRIAKVVTSASAITSIIQYGFDSLNNQIYRTDIRRAPKYYYNTTDSITVVAPFNCTFEVKHTESGWGYAGGSHTKNISDMTDLTTVGEELGDNNGGDIVSRPFIASKVFEGGKAGTSYTFTIARVGAALQGGYGRRFNVKCIPV